MDFKEETLTILTTAKRQEVLGEIGRARDNLYKLNADPVSIINSTLNTDLAAIATLKLQSNPTLKPEDYLKSLAGHLESLDEFGLTIAFTPTLSTIRRLHSWVYQNISQDILIDISIDKSIIAGAIIVYKGKYLDYALGQKL